MDSAIKTGLDLFSKKYNCAQAVLAPFAEKLGLPMDGALRLASSFGAGVSRQGEVCGAVSGALMVLGLCYGKDRNSDSDAKELCYEKTTEFISRFTKEEGSILCRDLLKIDMADSQVWQKAGEAGKFENLCPLFVEKAIGITEDLMRADKDL